MEGEKLFFQHQTWVEQQSNSVGLREGLKLILIIWDLESGDGIFEVYA